MNRLVDEPSGSGRWPRAPERSSSAHDVTGLIGTPGMRKPAQPVDARRTFALIATTIVGLAGWAAFGESSRPLGAGAAAAASGRPVQVSAIAAKVDPGAVDIVTEMSYEGYGEAGTGIVLSSSGEVLTNNHVIANATHISVTDVGNGRSYSATVVGYDPATDVAVVQMKGALGLHTAPIGNSDSAKVGQAIIGIGNGRGAGGTPSAAAGSITALDQSNAVTDPLTNAPEELSGLIAINAPIRPGDSGGPLVNDRGQVIGMDTAGYSSGGVSHGFAIPIDAALAVAREIEAGRGSATVHVGATAFIGVGVTPAFGGSSGAATGLEVVTTVAGMPGARAGLVAGDVITSIAGHRLTTDARLADVLLLFHPGAQVKVDWTDTHRGRHSSMITLASGPPA